MAFLGNTANGTTTINIQYLPQYLVLEANKSSDAFSIQNVTKIKVTILGDGTIFDLDANGLEVFNNMYQYSQIKGNNLGADVYGVGYRIIQLSNGFIQDKTVQIEITAGGVQPVYGFSLARKGTLYLQSIQQLALANSGLQLPAFMHVAIPDFQNTDELNIQFADGLNQKFLKEELMALKYFYQAEQVQSDNDYPIVFNTGGTMKQLNYIPTQNRNVYIQRFKPVGDLSVNL